jgi:hypothetical protein
LGLLLGLAVVVYAVMLRLGKSAETREWAFGSEQRARQRILMLPGSGFMYMAAGFWGLSRFSEMAAVGVGVSALVGVVPVLWAGLQIPMPVFFYPKWARERRLRIRARAKTAKS